MFEQAVLSNGPASKRVWTTFAGVTGQALLVTIAVMIPMMFPEAMPSVKMITGVFAPPSPPPPPPKGAPSTPQITHAIQKQFIEGILTQPRNIPPVVKIFVDPPPALGSSDGVVGGMEGGSKNGVVGAVLDVIRQGAGVSAPSRPAPPHPIDTNAKAAPPEPLRVPVGGRVQLAEPIFRPEPAYPPIARQMRVQGVVELQGVIGVDGHIKELRVLSGHPLLTKAALEAVQRWIYRPTTLNERPVEVIAPITVTFRLN